MQSVCVFVVHIYKCGSNLIYVVALADNVKPVKNVRSNWCQ